MTAKEKPRRTHPLPAWDPYAIHTCRDCGATEGALHDLGCGMERCPFCGGQLIICDCCYTLTGLYDPQRYGPETAHLPEAVYAEGLPEPQTTQWLGMLDARGRVPYIRYPFFCARCGEPWCEMFHVPDAEWDAYIQKDMRDQVLCRRCYDWIKAVIDREGAVNEARKEVSDAL
jgi:hypothetical protein